eukprot:scaffold9663_cov31-Tisochrysis_lutea.AAC.3
MARDRGHSRAMKRGSVSLNQLTNQPTNHRTRAAAHAHRHGRGVDLALLASTRPPIHARQFTLKHRCSALGAGKSQADEPLIPR